MPIDSDIRNAVAEETISTVSDAGARDALRTVKDKFAINVKRFPSDLGGPDLLHYVTFGINVRGKSKLVPENKRLFEVKRSPDSANLTEDQLGSGTLRVATAGAAGVGAAVATTAVLDSVAKGTNAALTAVSSKVAKAVNLTGATSQLITTVAGAGVGAAVGGAILATDLLQPDKTFRISDVISLYVDGPPAVKYAMQYANKELGTLAGVLSGATFDSQGAISASAETLAAFGATMAKLPGAFGAADVGAALSKSTGTALNPFKEVVFEAVDFRSFAFKYKFLPKSKQESDEIKQIIDLFKFHMHPEISQGKMFFIYPSEFQITYYYGGKRNEYFHQFRPCVLESMEVTYGGEQFSSFNDGHPTEVNLSLTFRETEIITRNMIGDNGAY